MMRQKLFRRGGPQGKDFEEEGSKEEGSEQGAMEAPRENEADPHAELKQRLRTALGALSDKYRTCLRKTWTPEELLEALDQEGAYSEIADLEGATPYWVAERTGRGGVRYMVLVIGSANKEPPEQLGGTYNATRNWVLDRGVHSRMMTLDEVHRRAKQAPMTAGPTSTWVESGDNQAEATYAWSDSNGEVVTIREAPFTLNNRQLGVYRVLEIPLNGINYERTQTNSAVGAAIRRRPIAREGMGRK